MAQLHSTLALAPRPGRMIGRGRSAEIFEYGSGRVIKLYFHWRNRSEAEHEFAMTRAAYAKGVPVPEALDLIRIEARQGIVFERIDGVSMLQALQQRSWTLLDTAHQMAELHAEVHRHKAPPQSPAQCDQVESCLDEPEKAAVRRITSTLSTGDTLCHGDLHPANILCTRKGPVIIDWSSAASGNPVGDVALTSLLICGAAIPGTPPIHMRLLVRCFRHVLNRAYLTQYFRAGTGSRSELEGWKRVQKLAIAAAQRCRTTP